MNAKATLRKAILHNRRLLVGDEWQQRVDKVNKLALDLVRDINAQSCHVFLPIQKNNEPDTWPLIEALDALKIKVMLSVSDFSDCTMAHFYYSPEVKFEQSKFHIPEPVNAEPADVFTIDVVFIPLLAADKQGNRIGYGKGFYDRLLAEMPENVLKVGLNLAPLFDAFNFAASHDIKLDYCITPHEIYKCHD